MALRARKASMAYVKRAGPERNFLTFNIAEYIILSVLKPPIKLQSPDERKYVKTYELNISKNRFYEARKYVSGNKKSGHCR